MQKFLLIVVFFCFAAVQQTVTAQSSSLTTELDGYVDEVIESYGIPGVALAVVKDGTVIHKKNYGFANLEHQVPVRDHSIFRVYSLTKLMVVTGVFQLIEQGKLSLDDDIARYVPGLPASWQALQIKHLLTHSSGLPDMSPIPVFQDLTEEEAKAEVFAQSLKADPGAVYDYNQTNFWLIKEIIEHVAGEDMDTFILGNQFGAAPDTAFFSVDSRNIIQNRATAYFPFATGRQTIEHPYLMGDYAYAMNGLNITLDAFIHWDAAIRSNALISAGTRQQMWETFPYAQSQKQFTYGWDKRLVDEHVSFGFSGSLVTAYRIFPDDNLSIIFLGNGMGDFFDIEVIVNRIATMALD